MFRMQVVGRIGLVCLAPAVLAAGGCGGSGDFGESVVVPQEQHTRVDANFGASKPLSLPTDVLFNVADAQRFSQGDAAAVLPPEVPRSVLYETRAGIGLVPEVHDRAFLDHVQKLIIGHRLALHPIRRPRLLEREKARLGRLKLRRQKRDRQR